MDPNDLPGGTVPPDDACPRCGEDKADRLVWQDDDVVECQTCGTRYEPGRGPVDRNCGHGRRGRPAGAPKAGRGRGLLIAPQEGVSREQRPE
jgi:hypothetical protein